MSAKFYTLLTDIGAAKLASAAALGVPLKITHMAVGSGGGALPTPNAQQTALVAEERRAALNMLYIDPQNSSQIIAEQVIPENEGGWWIREVGLFDETGALIAVGNCPESYKPKLAEGSGRTQTVRMVLITSSTDNITLKIDPAVVLATRKYVDDKVLELKVYVDDLMAKHLAAVDPHSQYAPKDSPTLTGMPKTPTPPAGNNSTMIASTAFVQAAILALIGGAPATLDTLKEIAAAINNDPNFSTTINNALALKAPLASPALTGTPTAPTAAQTVNNTQIATTAFVKAAIAGLVGSSPEALDTLNELAAALGNDPNFATTVMNALAGKQPLDATLTNLSGKSVSALLQYLGLDRIEQTAIETRIKSPGGGTFLVVDDSKWGCWIDGIGSLALGLDYGGTGAKTASGALANLGIGPIATAAEVTSGTSKKLVDAARLVGAIATDADIQNATSKKLVDALGLINAITTMQDVQNGALRKLVNAQSLKNYLPTKALGASDFIRIPDVPGGTIIQYGQVVKSISEGVENVVLPTPFPNSARFAIAIPLNQSSSTTVDIFAQLQSASTTGINFYFSWGTSSTPANGYQWFAIGY